jgi:uncharacterized membrane protein (UPF0127 family)
MRKKITLKSNGKLLEIPAKKCNALQKISGLMFKTKDTQALLFEFSSPTKMAIHSFFVFFPFYAIWLGENNKIIDIKKVKPFSFHIRPKKSFLRLLELPINNKYKEFIELLKSKT